MPDLDQALTSIPCPRHAEASTFALDLRGKSPSSQTISRWLRGLGRLQHAAAGTPAFFQDAARAVVETVGLDYGAILLRAANGWKVAAEVPTPTGNFLWGVVDRVALDRCTYFHDSQLVASLQAESTVSISPIFDEANVLGVVYGARLPNSISQRRGIRPLEAQLMQLVAETVTAGLERFHREAEVARTRVWLEQAFSPEIARELESNPQLLDGHEREITILFGDLRGFAQFTERLDSATTYRLLGDVMDRLTRVVIEHRGTIIDYYGDGFAAMWNAPIEQSDHSTLACNAALRMFDEIPRLNQIWSESLGTALRLGVGIHRGLAQVGNAGTSQRLKYGPRGNTVNLASRVEGATKHLDVSLLVTDEVRRHLPASFVTRRVAMVQLDGISTPVDLFDVFPHPVDNGQLAAIRVYEAALAAYEGGDFSRSANLLMTLENMPLDFELPKRFLERRIQRYSRQTSSDDKVAFSPAIKLPK